MIRNRLSWLVLVAIGWLSFPTAASAQPMPTRLDLTVKDVDAALANEWLGVYHQGKKVGYINVQRTKIKEDGKTLYREKSAMTMKLLSLDQKIEVKLEQTSDFEAKPPFRMLRADYLESTNEITQRIRLVAKDKGFEVAINEGGVLQKKMIGDLDYTLADSLSADIWIKRKPKKGDTITTRDLKVDKLKIELSTTTFLDTKKGLVGGVKTVIHEVKSFNHESGGTVEEKHDEHGRMISAILEGGMEVRRETEEQAKNTEFSSDMFLEGLAKLDKGIGSTKKLSGMVLEIHAKEAALLPDGPRQTLLSKGNDLYQLRLGKQHGKIAKATEADIKEGLEETVAYPIGDAKIKALAQQAVGDAKSDEEKAKNICKFVHDFIKPAMNGVVPRMFDLLERKTGDCKSYSLLFTCLARAASLPSRQVSGLVYMGDDWKAFGGHAWNEVLLNGYWVPVDASMNQIDADPTHICLGTDKESGNNMLKIYGKLNFKLLEVERGK